MTGSDESAPSGAPFGRRSPFAAHDSRLAPLAAPRSPLTAGVPVDVIPLLAAVSFGCGLGVYYGLKQFWVDHTLRLKRTG